MLACYYRPITKGCHRLAFCSQNDVRRRREAKIQQKVQEIQEKARATEDWEERKKLLIRPLSVCAAILLLGLGGTFLAYYRYSHS